MIEIETNSLGRLEKGLRTIKKPQIGENTKLRLRNRIMGRVSDPVGSYVQSLVSEVSLSMEQKARIKERIFEVLESRMQKKFVFRNLLLFHKKMVSVMMMLMIVFSMFVFVNVDTTIVRAESFTRIATFDGSISVERDGRILDVYPGMEIKERDKILTGSDGFVTIKYFEDSVSRLASNTELVINKLFKMNDSTAKSYVEVSLVDGMLWSRVVNLVEKESAFVVKSNEISTALHEGAVNVESDGRAVDVEVYDAGTDVGAIKDEWVQANLQSDEQYLREKGSEILLAKMESIGAKGVEDVSLKKSLREEALLFLTFDDIKKRKVELDLAERNFVAVQIKLESGVVTESEKLEAQKIIDEFVAKVNAFREFVEEISKSDRGLSDNLNDYLDDKIWAQRKSLGLVSEDHPVFIARKVVDNLFVPVSSEVSNSSISVNGVLVDVVSENANVSITVDASAIEKIDVVVNRPAFTPVSVIEEPVATDVAEEFDVGVQGDKLLSPFVDY